MSDEAVSGWRIATYTGGQGNCVEVGRSATAVAVRDTKDREGGPVLRFLPVCVAGVHGAAQEVALTANRPLSGAASGRGLSYACRLALHSWNGLPRNTVNPVGDTFGHAGDTLQRCPPEPLE